VANEATEYASALHADVEAMHGEVSREHLEIIQAAAAWHQHGLYTLRVLRVDHDKLTPEARVGFSGEIARSVQKRVDQVKLLELGKRPDADLWSSLHHVALPAATNGKETTNDVPQPS
jgi:hypothetical protein